MCSNPELLKNELIHLKEVLSHCKYPKWAIHKVLHQQQEGRKTETEENKATTSTKQTKDFT